MNILHTMLRIKEIARIVNPRIKAAFPVFTRVESKKAKHTKHIMKVKNMANRTNQFVFRNIVSLNAIPLKTDTKLVKNAITVNVPNHET